MDPLEIDLKGPAQNERPAPQAQEKKSEQAALNLKRIKFRLTHEKKSIVFMMHTCRKVRNLAKNRKELGEASDR